MKIALVYDRVNKWGGAERVLLALHETFPDAPLYTSVYDPKAAPWAKVFPNVQTSFLQRIPFAKRNHELLGVLMPLAFESFDFSGYDLVISVTSEAAKGIITKPGTLHLCYCLTPTRYLWSHYKTYFKGASFKGISWPVVRYLRAWDKIAAQRPDEMIAISTGVQSRIKKYYHRDSKIVFPPVNISSSSLHSNRRSARKEYFLIVSRLVPYKRVDLAIEAFSELGLPLVVVGKGSQAWRLKLAAKKNIKFVGEVSEERLLRYYRGAKALIMPQEEDFGIVAVEAQAMGTPAIAFKKGGALETVIDGKTGVFFDKQTAAGLMEAVRNFNDLIHQSNSGECLKNAKRFSKEKFQKELEKIISLYYHC